MADDEVAALKGRIRSLEKDRAVEYDDIVISRDNALQQVQHLQSRLKELEQSTNDQAAIHQETASALIQANQELESQVQAAQELARQIEHDWSSAIIDIVAALSSGSEISPSSTKLILGYTDARFVNINDFTFVPTIRYSLADSWVNIQEHPRTTTSPSMLDLLKMIRGDKLDIEDNLTRLVWLDSTLLKEIHDRSKTEGIWILLAYRLVLALALDSMGVARCLAYTQLTELARQYQPNDKQMWIDVVANLISTHGDLDNDILGQACICRLVLTTNQPEQMAMLLHHIPRGLIVDRFLRIDQKAQEIVNLIYDKQTNVDRRDLVWSSGNSIIIVLCYLGKSAEFASDSDGSNWVCSPQGVRLSDSRDGVRLLLSDDRSYDLPPQSWHHINLYFQKFFSTEWQRARMDRASRTTESVMAEIRGWDN
jgi:hypothetical protein